MPQPKQGRGGRAGGGGGQDLTPDALAPAPGEEGARLIVGVLGESDVADHVRLYLDLEFRKSYDIANEAIVRREKLSADQSPLGVESSAVWVRPDTVLNVRQSETRRIEDEFLAGDFTAEGSFSAEAPVFSAVGRPRRPPRSALELCLTINHPAKCITRAGAPGCAPGSMPALACGIPTAGACWTVGPSQWEVC